MSKPEFKSFTLSAAFLILLAGLGCSGCLASVNKRITGSGKEVETTRDLGSFSGVVLSEEGDLFISVGQQEQLVIAAEDNLQEYLTAEIDGGVLEIKKTQERITLNPTRPIRYYLTVKELTSLVVKNSGNVEITAVTADRFSLRISGSGNVQIGKIEVADLAVALTSSGSLTIEQGRAEDQQIRLSSSGSYDGLQVECRTAVVELSSSGEARLTVQEALTLDLSSSGNVYYQGQPRLVIQDVSSSGRAVSLP